MTWVKLSDTFAEEPRWEELGAEAMALHIAALCCCNRVLTDGRLRRARAEGLFPVSDPVAVVDALIAAGVWRANGDDIEIVDYLKDQPSKEKVEADREAARDRMKKLRSHERSHERSRARSTTPSRPGVLTEHKGRDGAAARSAKAPLAAPPEGIQVIWK